MSGNGHGVKSILRPDDESMLTTVFRKMRSRPWRRLRCALRNKHPWGLHVAHAVDGNKLMIDVGLQCSDCGTWATFRFELTAESAPSGMGF